MQRGILPFLLAGALLAGTRPAAARVKLSTLPQRERVEIQLDHGRATLIEEERIVTLLASNAKRGNNRIDFSWSNAGIDKDSIQFRPIAVRAGGKFRPVGEVDGRPEVAVVNVSYPPNENALVWEVYAARPCALKVRVSYLIANLGRTFAYRAVADREETHLTLRKYLVVHNRSGESFEEAGLWAGFGPRFERPLEQSTDVKLLLHRFREVPIRKTFTFDWYAHGPLNPDKPLASRILLHYELNNDERHGMGRFPLQPGKVRIFVEDGHGGEAFLGEDWARLTPLDHRLRLYLGESRDIVCTRTIRENRRHAVRGNLFDQEIVLRYEIENFKDKPATLDIVEQLNRLAQQYGRPLRGDVEWELGERTSKELRISYESGGARPVLHVRLPARPADPDKKVEKLAVEFHVILKNLW